MMAQIGIGLGLVLVVEGLLYALVPRHLKRMMLAMQELSEEQLRLGGAAALGLGVLVVWLVKSLAAGAM